VKGFWKGLMIGPLSLVIFHLGLAYLGGLPPFYYLKYHSLEANLEAIEGVEVTIPYLVRGWVLPDLYDGALLSAASLSRDGLVRVGPQVAFVKVNRNVVMVDREREGKLACEVWRNED
jgi:hypothetical protein